MSAKLTVTEASALGFGRGVRKRYDEARSSWALMAPERVLMLDEMAETILKAVVEEKRTVKDAVDHLADAYGAPRDEIAGDVIEFLQGLTDKGFLSEV